MHQTVLVAGVYLIPVLVIEQRCNILEGFLSGSAGQGPLIATIYARGDVEGRIIGGNLCDALACRNLTHVDGRNWSNCIWNFCQDNLPQIVLHTNHRSSLSTAPVPSSATASDSQYKMIRS